MLVLIFGPAAPQACSAGHHPFQIDGNARALRARLIGNSNHAAEKEQFEWRPYAQIARIANTREHGNSNRPV